MRHWSEGVARRYLEGLGYRILAENFCVRGGELDLVAEDAGVLVFVEVKQRRTDRYGAPAEGITPAKIARLQRAALLYISETFGRDDLPLRFDAVFVSGSEKEHRLEHLKGAF